MEANGAVGACDGSVVITMIFSPTICTILDRDSARSSQHRLTALRTSHFAFIMIHSTGYNVLIHILYILYSPSPRLCPNRKTPRYTVSKVPNPPHANSLNESIDRKTDSRTMLCRLHSSRSPHVQIIDKHTSEDYIQERMQ
jgi:hypothetical protein